MNSKRTFTFFVLLMAVISVFGQSNMKMFDDLTFQWDLEAAKLSSYEGLIEFCNNDNYRYETIDILRGIHHYDSLIYESLLKARRKDRHNHSINKTIKEIESFENNYSTKSFIQFLRKDCKKSTDLEKNSDDLRKDSGEGSYDNQVYVLEVELGRYVHHITKKVDHIRNLTHHIYD